MKEIGSFIELELSKGKEWYSGSENIARLNTGRAAIWHAFRVMGVTAIWIPYYQCESVREFLCRKGCRVRYYHQDRNFNPVDLNPADSEAVLLVNYYGVMSWERMRNLAGRYRNAIIDNCQAFFCKPVAGALNVYSSRKFVGVADGAYVIGEGAHRYFEDYPQGYSSDTAAFLMKRIEYGCEGEGYKSRTLNENRLDAEDAMKMSKLTFAMLDGADYEHIIARRKENFRIACGLFDSMNEINPTMYFDQAAVPMVYPLVVENDALLEKLLAAKHFQGHWWKYICGELSEDTFEHWISRYVIPITIDQRYGESELRYIFSVVERVIQNKI